MLSYPITSVFELIRGVNTSSVAKLSEPHIITLSYFLHLDKAKFSLSLTGLFSCS